MTKLKRQLSISITAEEAGILDKLQLKGIKVVQVFRRGMNDYIQESISDLTQNNNA